MSLKTFASVLYVTEESTEVVLIQSTTIQKVKRRMERRERKIELREN
jgi:hypothetical protein